MAEVAFWFALPILTDGLMGLSSMTLYNHLSFDGGPVCDGQRWMWVGGRKKVVVVLMLVAQMATRTFRLLLLPSSPLLPPPPQ